MKYVLLTLFVSIIGLFSTPSHSQNCIDSSLINPNAACFEIYMPVCGCNGVTYSNSCYATVMGGVTSYTEGPCAGGIIDAEPCSDLADVDFGFCAMYMGIVIINGQCTGISGCGWIVDGVNYLTASYNSIEECEACLESVPIDVEPCTDVADVDFGECDMFMGIAVVNGQCVGVSGCGFLVDDFNYAPAFYSSIEDCQACLENEPIDAEPCSDLQNLDFGPCSMFLGYAVSGGQCLPFSGCSTISNNVDYQNAFYATESECELCLGSNGLNDINYSLVKIYPNPSADVLNIKSEVEIQQLQIVSCAGTVVFVSNAVNKEFVLQANDWAAGVYFVHVLTEMGSVVLRFTVN